MNPSMPDALLIVLSFFCGALVHTVAGFGSALVTMPMLTLVLGVEFAAPLQAVTALGLTALVFYQHRHEWRWRESTQLILTSVIGVPIGAWALVSLPAHWVTGTLGILLLVYGVFELAIAPRVRRGPWVDRGDDPRWDWGRLLAGLCSGILGGAYNTNGPPLIFYAVLRHWPRGAFKSGLQSVFFVQGIAIVGAHGASGLITNDILRAAAISVPGMMLGMFAGTFIDRRIDQAQFRQTVFMLILLMGVLLTLRSWW